MRATKCDKLPRFQCMVIYSMLRLICVVAGLLFSTLRSTSVQVSSCFFREVVTVRHITVLLCKANILTRGSVGGKPANDR